MIDGGTSSMNQSNQHMFASLAARCFALRQGALGGLRPLHGWMPPHQEQVRQCASIDDRAAGHLQPALLQNAADFGEQPPPQIVLFEQAAKARNSRFAGHRLTPQVNASKAAHACRFIQRFFQSRIGQVALMLQQVQPQHLRQAHGRTAIARLRVIRFQQIVQRLLRNGVLHFVQKFLALGLFAIRFKAALCQRQLFHRSIPVFAFIPACLTQKEMTWRTLAEIP